MRALPPPDDGNGAAKVELLGPEGNAYCNGSGVIAGEAGGFGFAILNAASGELMTEISVKKLAPDTSIRSRSAARHTRRARLAVVTTSQPPCSFTASAAHLAMTPAFSSGNGSGGGQGRPHSRLIQTT